MRLARDRAIMSRWLALFVLAAVAQTAEAFPVSGAAWSNAQWEQHCKEVRTTYNPTAPLRTDRLMLKPDDERAHFLEHIGGPESPYYRYVFHQESGIDPARRVVTFRLQGVSALPAL